MKSSLISASRVFAALRLTIICVVQGAIWGQGAPPPYDFVTNGIREAHVDSVNGTTRLIINGQPVPPLVFMDQEDFLERLQSLAPQVQDAGPMASICFKSVSTTGLGTTRVRLPWTLRRGNLRTFHAHQPRGLWPIQNGGEPAVLYCFAFLYLSTAGPGPVTLGRVRKSVR
jgi:hypothetical protein